MIGLRQFVKLAGILLPATLITIAMLLRFTHVMDLGGRKITEIPHYVMTDQSGHLVTEADYHGRFQLIYFGYTYCPDVCPTSLALIAGALQRLGGRANRIVPIFMTIDPERDAPEAVGTYVRQFREDMVGLSGTTVQTAEAAKQFGVVYAKNGEGDNYTMDHSADIYLVGPDGRFLTSISHSAPTQRLAEILDKYLN